MKPKLFITGGDAGMITGTMRSRGEIVPDLVLQGLAVIAAGGHVARSAPRGARLRRFFGAAHRRVGGLRGGAGAAGAAAGGAGAGVGWSGPGFSASRPTVAITPSAFCSTSRA